MNDIVRDKAEENVKHEVLERKIELTPTNRTDRFAIAMMGLRIEQEPKRMPELYEKYIEPRVIGDRDLPDAVIFQLVILETNRVSAEMMQGAVKKPDAPE